MNGAEDQSESPLMVRKSNSSKYHHYPRLTPALLVAMMLLLGLPPAAADGTRGLRPHLRGTPAAGQSTTTVMHADVSKLKGSRSGRDVLLEWVTLREIANKGFEVHRACSESRGWRQVGFVPGGADGGFERSYSYHDRNVSPEDLRYMLRIIGTDGSIQYSRIITVQMSARLRSFVVDPAESTAAVPQAAKDASANRSNTEDERRDYARPDFRTNQPPSSTR